MGDFNIHINKRGEDATVFMNTIESLGFQQHSSQHTEWATLLI